MLLSAFEDSRFQPSFTFLRPRKKGTFSYLALPHSEQRHGMRAVASRSVVVPPGPSQAGRRDGRIGARVHAVVARASPRARGVRASAAADVVDIPLRQDAMDDTGVSVGSLTRAVMALEDDSAEAMFECILEWATVTKKMELYEAQEEAIMELVEGNSVLLTTPTGSGKTLVATAAIAAATAAATAASTAASTPAPSPVVRVRVREHAVDLLVPARRAPPTFHSTAEAPGRADVPFVAALVIGPHGRELIVLVRRHRPDAHPRGHRRRAEMEGEQELRRGIFSFSRNVIRLHRVRGTRARRRAHHSPFFYTHLSHSHHHRSPSSFPQSLIP